MSAPDTLPHPAVLRGAALPAPGMRSARFEGGEHGAPVSFFLVHAAPGEGPDLHRHPYPETLAVQAGLARFTVDGETIEARAGDVLVVPAGTPHGFKNAGSERLDLVAIHAAGTMAQEWIASA